MHDALDFWRFVALRQAAWWEKQAGKPRHARSPDPLLSSAHFPNILRELDDGTIFFQDHRRSTGHAGSLDLFDAIAYRLVNRRQTFELLGWPTPGTMGPWLTSLSELASRQVIFTGRHQTIGLRRYFAAATYIAGKHTDLWAELEPLTLQEAWNRLATWVPGLSKFFAWQVCCDLLESSTHSEWSEDQWAFLGPGPQKALTILYGEEKTALRANERYLQFARRLRDMQPAVHATVGLRLPPEFPFLTLKNIEHALCEYFRYTWASWKT